MAANQSILELMTSPFGLESMKYCFSKVSLEAKLPDQKFFRNIRQRNFDSGAQAPCWSIWKSNISLTLSQKEKLLAQKLTDWQPFKLQNSNGRGGLNF